MQINNSVPVVQKDEIIIKATTSKVWEVLTNINQWSSWNNKISKSVLKTTLAPDVTFKWKTGGSQIQSKVHTFEPDTKFGWTGKAFGARAIHNWNIFPLEDGCKVSVEESMEGWIVKLISKMMNRKLEEDMRFWLKGLKAECERVIK